MGSTVFVNAPNLTAGNLFGANTYNLLNIAIIFLNDLLYRRAPIFETLSQNHIFTTFVVIFLTVIVIAGLVLKPKKKTKLGLSNYAIGLIVVFIIGAYINFMLGMK